MRRWRVPGGGADSSVSRAMTPASPVTRAPADAAAAAAGGGGVAGRQRPVAPRNGDPRHLVLGTSLSTRIKLSIYTTHNREASVLHYRHAGEKKVYRYLVIYRYS